MLYIVLGKTSSIYNAGELLTGDIVIKTSAYCKILNLTVNYCGVSMASFIVSEGEGKARIYEKVKETHFHLDVLHSLIKSYRGIIILPGVHIYHFRLKLPQLLPSSYKSQYGEISYYIHVHLQTSDTTLDIRKPFNIVAPINIVLFSASQNPYCAEVVKKYGLIRSKTLILKASISNTCYVPGDVLPVVVEVFNETGSHLQYLFCTLKQVIKAMVQLRGKMMSRDTKKCLVTVAHKVKKNSCYLWHCQLPSPSFLTHTVSASSIIQLTYCVQVSAKLKGVPIPPEVNIPVVFGIRTAVPLNVELHDQATENSLSFVANNITCSEEEMLTFPNAARPHRRATLCTANQARVSVTAHLRSIARRLSVHLQT